jgi:hypothetical protein
MQGLPLAEKDTATLGFGPMVLINSLFGLGLPFAGKWQGDYGALVQLKLRSINRHFRLLLPLVAR